MLSMTPAERLMARKLDGYTDEGYDVNTALTRTANELGVARERVLQVWMQYRVEDLPTVA